jgi:hypothetical protein
MNKSGDVKLPASVAVSCCSRIRTKVSGRVLGDQAGMELPINVLEHN